MLSGHEYFQILVGLLAIVSPFAITPIFLSVTADQTPVERKRSARISAITVGCVLICAAVFGQWILMAFGIDIPTFSVGGGILLLLVAISMLHAKVSPTKHKPEEAEEAAKWDSVAVVPLGIPLLAGPGAISTTILYAARGHGLMHLVLMCLIVIILALIVWITQHLASQLSKAIGRTGINIASRVMGLILAAVAVQFMAVGLKQLFPVLAGS